VSFFLAFTLVHFAGVFVVLGLVFLSNIQSSTRWRVTSAKTKWSAAISDFGAETVGSTGNIA